MSNGVSFSVPENGRLIMIADCHGDYVLFKRLLKNLAICEDDVLAFLGDFSNKGAGSYACVNELMLLDKSRKNTIVLAGNGEYSNIRIFLSGDQDKILNYCKKWPKNNLYRDWAAQCGFSEITQDNFDRVHQSILASFSEQMQWLRDLPLYAVSDEFVLVHAAMPEIPSDGMATIGNLVSDDFIYTGENRTGRWQIIGHMPVNNMQGQIVPCVDAQRKIINIDGGVNTVAFTQLNALIWSRKNGFELLFDDHDPTGIVLEDYDPAPQTPLVHRWADRWITVLERGKSFSLCETRTGRVGMVKNEFIRADAKGDLIFAGASYAALIQVRKGERVKIMDESADDHVFVKNTQGYLGYVPREIVRPEPDAADRPFAFVRKLKI